ncbi:hypothetical protein ACWENS_05445 [Streptomyces sp. NPDC004532]
MIPDPYPTLLALGASAGLAIGCVALVIAAALYTLCAALRRALRRFR